MRLEPRRVAGYTRAAKWSALLADGRSVFVKTAADDAGRAAITREAALLAALEGPFIPVLHGSYEEDGQAVLVLEDLGRARWPPPYPDDLGPLVDALAAVADTAAPALLRSLPGPEAAWARVAEQPEPLLGLRLCSRGWLERALPILAAAEARVVLDGDQIVHNDVWSGNLCFAPRGVVLVDWAEARRGNAELDTAFALLSFLAEHATRPPGLVLRDEGAWASYLAGSLATRAPGPLPAWAEPGSTFLEDLRGDLAHALRWAAERLELPPPDGLSA